MFSFFFLIEEGSGKHPKVDLAFINYSFLENCRKLPSNNIAKWQRDFLEQWKIGNRLLRAKELATFSSKTKINLFFLCKQKNA
jgi:hypothetical protein